MSYQANYTNKAQEIVSNYTSRYVQTRDEQAGWEDLSEGGDFYSADSGAENFTTERYNELAQGEGEFGGTDYLHELTGMQGDIEGFGQGELPEFEDRFDTAEAASQLNSLEAEVKKSHLPASLKEDFLKQIRDIQQMLEKEELEDGGAVEDLQEEWKSTLEENPSVAARLVKKLGEDGIEANEAQIQEAMEKFGITEKSLAKMTLPGDKDLHTRLMGFFQEVNPTLAQSIADDPQKGFGPEALKQLQDMLELVYSKGVDPSLPAKLMSDSQKVPWNVEGIIGKFTGTTRHMESEINNRFYYCDEFTRSLGRLQQGQAFGGEDIQTYLNRGRNYCDNGARNKGTEIRRFLSGLYDYSEKNPYLFLHYLKQLPEMALIAMKDLLDYRGDGGCNATTKDMGDRWDTAQSSNILAAAISGGSLPSELQSETTLVLGAQMSQSEAN